MNLVILTGRMTKDPELSFLPGNGTAKTVFSLAVDRKFKKEGQPEADFINCQAFGKQAETISQYFSKGSRITITGRIQTGSYQAKDGSKRYTTDVAIDSFEFVDKASKHELQNEPGNFDGAEPDSGDTPF